MQPQEQRKIHLSRAEQIYGLQMIHFYRRHPVLAVRDILGLPVTSPHFRIALRAAWFCDHSILELSRGMMKSTIIAVISTLKALLYPNRTQLILGPQFRQGKMIFEDAGVEKILSDRMGRQVHRKGFANHSCRNARKVINRGNNDLWKIPLKNGSQLITGPLGKKGDTLLGIRANDIYLDEMRDFTKYQVTKVIKPFANVLSDPFSNESDADFQGNTFTYCGTIRYTDDYYYEIIDEYRKKMVEDLELREYGFCARLSRGKFCVVEFNYEDAFVLSGVRPKKLNTEEVQRKQRENKLRFYFRINVEEIEEDKDSATVSTEDWLAENKNFPIKLGSKEFPFALLRSISDEYEIDTPKIKNAEVLFPEALSDAGFVKSKDFVASLEPLRFCPLPTVMGVDVATESDKFAIVIIRPGTTQGNFFDHFVYAFAQSNMSYSDMLSKIYECIDLYSVARIHMDKRGGGTALRDMLRENTIKGRPPIVDMVSDPKAIEVPNGVDMLRLVNATAEYNTTRVNTIKARMQAKKLLMPRIVSIHPDEDMNLLYNTFQALRGQFGKIKSKPIGGGWKKYYVPESKSSDESLEKGYKDLFSASLYASEALTEYCAEFFAIDSGDFLHFPEPKFVKLG